MRKKQKLKSVLIVEPNPYHGVILPGFTDYFQKLGYKVDLLVRSENVKDSPFLRFSKVNMPSIKSGSAKYIKSQLKNLNIKEYHFIFISSNAYWEPGVYLDSYIKYLDFIPRAKYPSLLVEHNLTHLREDDCDILYKNKQVFTLFPFKYRNGYTTMLNPHYFGNIKLHSKSKVTRFISIGSINPDNRNFQLLFDSVRRLISDGNRLKVSLIGEGNINIPKDLTNNIKFLGKLTFMQMYKELEKSDFYLPLLDPTNIYQRRYLSETTTGSYLLILGFLKIPIINVEFARFYGFNSKNALIYQQNDLSAAMRKAIVMNNDKFILLQKALKEESKKIHNFSLKNLEAALNTQKKASTFHYLLEEVQLAKARTVKAVKGALYSLKVIYARLINYY